MGFTLVLLGVLRRKFLLPEVPGMGMGCGADSCAGGNWLENATHCIGWDTVKMAGGVWKHKSGMSDPQEIYF